MNGDKRQKLSDNEVALIRAAYQYDVDGCGRLALAKKYNTTTTQIGRLVSGEHRKLT